MIDDFSYLTSEKAKIFQLLEKNNIKLEYEYIDDLDAFLKQIYPIVLDAYKRNYKKYCYVNLFYEHDLNLHKISGYKKFYRYYDITSFDEALQKQHRDVAITLLISGSSGLDFTEWFSIEYDVNHNASKYIFSTHLPLHDLDEETTCTIFSQLGIKETEFLWKFRKKAEFCYLNRLYYNNLWDINGFSFCVDTNNFFSHKIITDKYSKYDNLFLILNDKIPTADFIDVLFKCNDDNYIGIELGVSDVSYITELCDYGIVDEDTKNYITNSKKTLNAKSFTIKIEWHNSKNMQIKWYNSERK